MAINTDFMYGNATYCIAARSLVKRAVLLEKTHCQRSHFSCWTCTWDILSTSALPINTTTFAMIINAHLVLGSNCDTAPARTVESSWTPSCGKDRTTLSRSEYPIPVRMSFPNCNVSISTHFITVTNEPYRSQTAARDTLQESLRT